MLIQQYAGIIVAAGVIGGLVSGLAAMFSLGALEKNYPDIWTSLPRPPFRSLQHTLRLIRGAYGGLALEKRHLTMMNYARAAATGGLVLFLIACATIVIGGR